jgi:hypothetical protein
VNITVVGLSHKTASLPLRERVALSYEELPRALAYVHVQAGNGRASTHSHGRSSKKALHQPITYLKRHSEDQDCLAVTRALFGLD